MPAPTQWTLSGGGIAVHYTTAGTGTLHYIDIGGPKTFTGPQIRVVHVPDLGTLVSVTLNINPVAQNTFTVLLPDTNLAPGHPRAPIKTDGIATHHFLFPPLGQREFSTAVAMQGSAAL